MLPSTRVHVSLEWLGCRLCELHRRSLIPKQYLLDVNRELVLLLEADLDSMSTYVSLDSALLQAIDTIYGPCSIDATECLASGGGSRSWTRERRAPRPSGL
jgi:hypothetical protein